MAQKTQRRQKAKMVMPSAFTVGNIFCGIFAMVAAMQGQILFASLLVIIGGFLDFFDGIIARLSKTFSNFGKELDSLADIISFGIAPAIIMYQFFLKDQGKWSWLIAFIFVTAGAIRLARFNIEHIASSEKKAFTGLPIPIAAGVLVSFVLFYHSELYQMYLSRFNHQFFLSVSMIVLAGLMVSNMHYPLIPKSNLKTNSGRISLAVSILFLACAVTVPKYTFFATNLTYVMTGIFRGIFLGLLETSRKQRRRMKIVKTDKKKDKEKLSVTLERNLIHLQILYLSA